MANISIGYQGVIGASDGLLTVSGTVATLPVGRTLGDTRVDGGVVYRLVYNAGNSQIPPGYAVCRSGTYNSCTISTVTESSQGNLGVVQHATIATSYYGWIAVKGFPVSLIASNISLATGATVGVTVNGKWITTDAVNAYGYNVGDLASGTATTDARATNGRFYINFVDRG